MATLRTLIMTNIKLQNKALNLSRLILFTGFSTLPVDLQLQHYMENQVSEVEGGFLCLVCGRKISRKNHMRRHIRDQHISAEKYLCPVCHKIANNKNSIYSHMKQMHGNTKSINYAKHLI